MHVELYAQGGLNIIDVSMFSQVYVKRLHLLLYLIALRTLSLSNHHIWVLLTLVSHCLDKLVYNSSDYTVCLLFSNIQTTELFFMVFPNYVSNRPLNAQEILDQPPCDKCLKVLRYLFLHLIPCFVCICTHKHTLT